MKFRANNFDLELTLASGQFFRYRKAADGFICQEAGHVFRVRQNASEIELEGWDEASFRTLFGLNGEYDRAVKTLKQDTSLKPILDKWSGLRLMNRDPWETSVSFLASIASNIPKIRLSMESLSRDFGRPVKFSGETYYSFPAPGSLKDLKKIRRASLGFRSEYIYGFNRLYTQNLFQKARAMPYPKANIFLQQFPGIGPKVADCICLFSLDKKEAFPCDIWIERIMKNQYDAAKKEVASFARRRWGRWAGYAQQFLYHEARSQKNHNHA